MKFKYFMEAVNEDRSSSSSASDDVNVTVDEIAKKHGIEADAVAIGLANGIDAELKNGAESEREAKNTALRNLIKDAGFYGKS